VHWFTHFLRFLAAFALVLGISLVYRHILIVNPTTVALTFLLAILAVSTVWGIAVSVFMSVVAMLAFNYYFLPPVGRFTVADPQNWVAASFWFSYKKCWPHMILDVFPVFH